MDNHVTAPIPWWVKSMYICCLNLISFIVKVEYVEKYKTGKYGSISSILSVLPIYRLQSDHSSWDRARFPGRRHAVWSHISTPWSLPQVTIDLLLTPSVYQNFHYSIFWCLKKNYKFTLAKFTKILFFSGTRGVNLWWPPWRPSLRESTPWGPATSTGMDRYNNNPYMPLYLSVWAYVCRLSHIFIWLFTLIPLNSLFIPSIPYLPSYLYSLPSYLFPPYLAEYKYNYLRPKTRDQKQ